MALKIDFPRFELEPFSADIKFLISLSNDFILELLTLLLILSSFVEIALVFCLINLNCSIIFLYLSLLFELSFLSLIECLISFEISLAIFLKEGVLVFFLLIISFINETSLPITKHRYQVYLFRHSFHCYEKK